MSTRLEQYNQRAQEIDMALQELNSRYRIRVQYLTNEEELLAKGYFGKEFDFKIRAKIDIAGDTLTCIVNVTDSLFTLKGAKWILSEIVDQTASKLMEPKEER